MAEFKPRSTSEGEDGDKDNSFVQDWLERMIEDDPEGQDSKKKSRFTKLFRPVFRMLFPRNEKGEAKTESKAEPSIFGANILGVSKDTNEDEDVPFSSPMDTEPLEKKEDVAEEVDKDKDQQVPVDEIEDSPDLATEAPSKSDQEEEPDSDSPDKKEEITDVSPEEIKSIASKDIGLEITDENSSNIESQKDYTVPEKIHTAKMPEQISKPETNNSAGPAILAFIGAEILSRKRDREIKKEQKKIEKEQKAEVKSLKETKVSKDTVSKLNDSNRQQIDSLIEKRKLSTQNIQKADVKKEKTSIKEKIKNTFVSPKTEEKPQLVQEPKNQEATPLLSILKDKDEEIRKKMERKEIEKLIADPEKEVEPDKNTERYFETRHEIKEHASARNHSFTGADIETKEQTYGGETISDIPDVSQQTVVTTKNHIEKSGNHHKSSSGSPQMTIQFIMLAGIIFAIIIIKLFLL